MPARDNDDFFTGTDDPMAIVEAERRKLDEVGRVWDEESSTVRAKDNTFTMTFDGRGEISELTFHGNRYRTLAPAELATRIIDAVKQGRLQSIEKMAEKTGSIPGLDVVGIATGKVDPRKAIDALMAPFLEDVHAPGVHNREQRGAGRG
ncbi:YbaB/EbfC family nucleoid-associated protein [Pseudonocardia sp. HH130630-07]|uniref:YbaB/EbfC family nucleoid-associated protein n=1 Tax=Pseudonocardia sp. HH130630-07 TaxID=1690815 RepID=UPI0008152628|nr:hypothetical protein [Pseudonocardia sp. HH130630-07]ANY07694.1 hypothetical protein AFB00_16915 [Pseudonocardia sp. HH130630-07]